MICKGQEQFNLEKNVASINKRGYESLVSISYIKGMANISDENTEPAPYCYPDEIKVGVTELMSARLFMKSGSDVLYSITRKQLVKSELPNNPIQAKDGAYIFMINLKKKSDDPNNTELELDIRIMKSVVSGHPQLISNVYYKSIVAAGEFFVKDGKMILCMDKTGGFYKELRSRNINTDEVIKHCFSPYLKSDEYKNDKEYKQIFVPCREIGNSKEEIEIGLVKILTARKFNFDSNDTIKEMHDKYLSTGTESAALGSVAVGSSM